MSLNATLGNNATTSAVTSKNGQSAGQFAASFVTAIVVFAIEAGIFLLIKDRFARIYQPRTFLVPERERTTAPEPGWFSWVKGVLSTSNSEFVQKCGLDAYFFLRYLRTLLKIFVPAALVILPILLPINTIGGRGANYALTHPKQSNVTGLDQLAWGNVAPQHTGRYWAHWLLALTLIAYVCYIAFDELRNYIRMRQAYLTSPQHRLRASATTVLVSAIPQKWCSVEALDGLYDVFPGGLRNIWINRNFDDLTDKISRRDKFAKTLEGAETDLIRKCFKKNEETIAKAEKKAGKKSSKDEKKRQDAIQDERGRQQAQGHGLTTGNPHQVSHTIRDALHSNRDRSSSSTRDDAVQQKSDKRVLPIPIVGEGIQVMTQGLKGVGRGLLDGVRGVNKDVNAKIDTTNGFIAPAQQPRHHEPHWYRGNDSSDTDRAAIHHRGIADSPSHMPARSEVVDASPTPAHESDRDSENTRVHDSPSQEVERKVEQKQEPEEPPSTLKKVLTVTGLTKAEKEKVEYPEAFKENFATDKNDAVWRKYIKEEERDTMRLPIFGWQWMFALPFIGQKVDTIYYCRKEVARLNVEIEDDQAHPERFPLMNSAFIQFNHQVAAHMACQAVSHHLPQQMAPRLVEIDPNDVIWNNMSIPWWQRYIRTAGVITIIAAMIVLWAIPVAFTSALSQITTAANSYTWLHWLLKLPPTLLTIVQGVLPTVLLSLLTFLLPLILEFLVTLQGLPSGMLVQLWVQRYYFFFLFVQLFLVVTLASAAVQLVAYVTTADGWTQIPQLLGENIPKASNYFFSYMLLQALSVSAGALLQIGSLIGWFLLAPLFDNTARAKFSRQTTLSNVQWGTFFPTYTNLACIGLIYSIISPLILVFNVITFSLFWFVYRYNTLYVTKFTRDTGGLLYPNAINYTFVGIYIMEVALIGMFFLVRDVNDNVACLGQAIGMIIILILTAVYQILLNMAFSPLFRYLPITLEDDATRRDQEFARVMHMKQNGLLENEHPDEDIEDRLEEDERREREEDMNAQQYEMQQIESDKRQRLSQQDPNNPDFPELEPYEFQNPEVSMDLDKGESRGYRIMRHAMGATANATIRRLPTVRQKRQRTSWADKSNTSNRRASNFGDYQSPSPERPPDDNTLSHVRTRPRKVFEQVNNFNPLTGKAEDVEAQQAARNQLSNALFAGVNDELEDLSPEERDALVQRAFQHSALRARRPVIWIPRDDLGVSDYEVRRMGVFSKHLWVSNVRQGLDSKGRCVYSGAPPDFSEVDLIQL